MPKHKLNFTKIVSRTLIATAATTFLVTFLCVPTEYTVYGGIAGEDTRFELAPFHPQLFTPGGYSKSFGTKGQCCDIPSGSSTEIIPEAYLAEVLITPVVSFLFFFAIFSLIERKSYPTTKS